MSQFTPEMAQAVIDPVAGELIDQNALAERLLALVGEQDVSLNGPGALLTNPRRNVLETGSLAELAEHPSHEHGNAPIATNMRSGTRSRTC